MKNNVLKWLGRVGATLLTTIVILVVGLYLVMAMLAWGPSTFAKKQFILSLQETGELGFMANWFCSQEEIDMIKKYTRKVNEFLKKYFLEVGIKLIDFKIEFGLDQLPEKASGSNPDERSMSRSTPTGRRW